ncbi:hypothetical protein [Christensenella tenuis]|uniref:Recombinase n=1 Tax=Christensenella tenuis TaxID=2763033 RepID=A0ABR7EFN9_9FIRM|nr:hypothetical protein [Christensenella tenuis]MBC5648473.1 hypothetical protein [Christensenella tenuis]
MGNLELYEKVRAVPQSAIRPIEAGRLKGKSDINPMWRIKTLTEQFGPCGKGWRPEIVRQWTEAGANGEIAAFVEIKLHLKYDDKWEEPISATGGSSFVAKETKGPYTSDECFKMAYTDALSVACKMLGIGADVYWDKDKTKYSGKSESDGSKPKASEDQIKAIREACFATGLEESKMLKMCNAEKWEDVTATSAAKALQWINTRANAV